MTAADYDPELWARETSLGRRVYNHNFQMARKGPTGWSLVKVVPMERSAKHSETTWLWQAKEAPNEALIQVNVTELEDWRSAQKHLLAILHHCMHPAVPRGSRALANVGDVIFVAIDPAHQVPAAAQLTRGNVAVAVRSVGAVVADVSKFAELVDTMLSSVPTKGTVSRTVLNRRQLTMTDHRGVAVLPVDLDKSGDWLKLIASSGEFRRKGRAIELVASDPDDVTVELITSGR